MEREARDMMIKDEMYKEIQQLRDTISKLKKYGEKLIDVKPDSWFPFSNRSEVSNEVGKKILLIIRGSCQKARKDESVDNEGGS